MEDEKNIEQPKPEKKDSSTLITLVASGVFALIGTVAGGVVKGYWDIQLAEQKYNSDLVLKALESNSAQERLESLRMLVSTNIIKEASIKEGVDKYILEKQKDPSTIPQVKPSSGQSLESPIIDNARIYLLSGKQDNATALESLKKEVIAAGFAVIGAKHHIDPGRPDQPEVRYFNATDKVQAEKIAEFMKFKLNSPDLPARPYKDDAARPGYIEIWLGR
jgi:hypothetical protein